MEKKQTSMGSLKISSGVIMKIAELAASEISGVSIKSEKLSGAKAVAERLNPPIAVRLTGEAAEIDVDIIVTGGHKAVQAAEAVQRSVKSAVQNMTGIAVSKVNVKIAGIKFSPVTGKAE